MWALQTAALKGDGLGDVFLLQADGGAICASPLGEHSAQNIFLKSFSTAASETRSIIDPCLFGSFDHVKPKCMWKVAEAVIGQTSIWSYFWASSWLITLF